ncbi:MAG: bifunctional glutamate N-acetyltransferase/amino-acid acetyltransferase ArgJ [Pseudomonadota bacterium]|nr:bifunctional glutamate N-acetyltransferase/amino-acid acetyltransferase ArgJ [Pseudomonadota bacterium]MEC8127506.1 bifunctional glutamate N-acetyltransferase/amino-acid acetyltransferase ArgJ [Pseudomonadota bacterium]
MTVSPLAPHAFPVLPDISGVALSTAASGMKYAGRDDMLLMRLEDGGTLAAVFTRSDMAAAPVAWCRQQLAGGGAPRALLVNAGNANAFTGDGGMAAVEACCRGMASRLGCAPGEVMMASTGVIGEPLDTTILAAQFDSLVAGVAGWQAAAEAIRTTDTFAKGAGASASIGSRTVHISGIAKGSGMIAPDMATMLGFIATDAALPRDVLAALLAEATKHSFNAITVDSDTSTNDSVYLMASGRAGNPPVSSAADPALDSFRAALDTVMQDLAKQIVRDGEGASKFITVRVAGAADDDAARRIGMAIANSPLVKTAIAGEDANWGRIVMAVGKAGAGVDPQQLDISVGGLRITAGGARLEGYDEAPVAAHMKGDEIDIEVRVGDGPGGARIWTCDLTHGYVSINADYRS